MKKQDIIVLSSIILVLIAMRSIFNIPNFNPIGAIALMGGILFHKKTTAFLVTIGALFLGDIILGLSSPIYMDYMFIANWVFGVSLVLLLISLVLSVREIHISMEALNVHLNQVLNQRKQISKDTDQSTNKTAD